MAKKNANAKEISKKMEKALKILPQSWVDNHTNLTLEEAKEAIYEASKAIDGIEEQQKDDVTLTDAKEVVKDLSSGYKDAIKLEKSRITFLLGKFSV